MFRKRDHRRTSIGCCFLTGAALSGCAPLPHFRADIQSENPDNRILAIHAAGEAKDRQALPLLVDRLEDEDEAVRFFAIQALEKIVGERMGYQYQTPPAERAQAVARWRSYLQSNDNQAETVTVESDATGQLADTASSSQ